jgi:hypothetical protein
LTREWSFVDATEKKFAFSPVIWLTPAIPALEEAHRLNGGSVFGFFPTGYRSLLLSEPVLL